MDSESPFYPFVIKLSIFYNLISTWSLGHLLGLVSCPLKSSNLSWWWQLSARSKKFVESLNFCATRWINSSSENFRIASLVSKFEIGTLADPLLLGRFSWLNFGPEKQRSRIVHCRADMCRTFFLGSGCSTAVERTSHNRDVMGSNPAGC